ncbi:uncharacterized protein LOC133931211 [Phragmites australis]|uniref:uncharacterized protein LOC133931211 n=1 Tax=Phragmites australis TaxID=29695 RepID=UPI002D765813|nr:uncharacterized protein LOC133931211 [Phragmites australis]
MDLLEHPLDAVAFRLYSLQEASAATGAAAWTCLAAVLAAAAAAGLWRLRSSTPTADTGALKPLELDPSPAEKISTKPASSSDRSRESAPSETTDRSPAPSPKERYTAYYHDGGCVGCCDVDEEEGDDYDEDEEEQEDEYNGVYQTSETTDPFGWEVVRSLPLSPTAAEMERYRSPTALSGSVVRLWDQGTDGGVTPSASPRRRSRVVGTILAF